MKLVASLLLSAVATSSLAATGAVEVGTAADDKITNLPDSPKVGFDMYSGYIRVGDTDRYLFYWLAESSGDPSKDPVLLWTNGGPGCSGLGGFMTEQGPFRPTANGSLVENPYAWNQLANVVFIEQPAGVGFSYTESPLATYNDTLAAHDNHLFVKGFFDKFPQFAKNDFYLTSESYGGHYLPTLSKLIVDSKDVPNFKGFAVGNPLTYMEYRNYGQYATYAGHQLVPGPTFDDYHANECRYQINNVSKACQALMDQMDKLTQDLDPYALDFPICVSQGGDVASATGRNERYQLLKAMARTPFRAGVENYFPDNYQPCDDDWAATYLNRADVQKAIHVTHGNVTWADCSDDVGGKYNADDVNQAMMPIYEYLFEHASDLHIMVYSGDDDSICSSRGSQEWIWNTGGTPDRDWAPWMFEKQVGGYTVKFPHFRYTTIHGAGHMCPATRPAQTLEALRRYLQGGW